MKKLTYTPPATEVVRVSAEAILTVDSGIDPGDGTDINGGETDSNTNPLDAKENTWGDIWED